jgi:hypothetical protein
MEKGKGMRANPIILEQMDTTFKIACECPFCGNVRHIVVDINSYTRWQSGELIQRAFPKLSPSQREGLMTGICDSCFP